MRVPFAHAPVAALLVTFLAAAPLAPAAAADNGFYVGGSLGQANANVDEGGVDFDGDEFGWKVFAGFRPLEWIAVEVAYTDFGSPSETAGPVRVDVETQALSAFGVVFLPLPVLDLYAKAGLAQIDTKATTSALGGLRFDDDNTDFAWGVGAQIGFGSLAVRAEYERFESEIGDPDFLSLGVLWTFL